MSELHEYLNGGIASEALMSVAKTKYEKESLMEGYSRFIAAAEDGCRLGRARSENLAWLVDKNR